MRPISFGRPDGDRTAWSVALFLVVGVIAPTACMLWFLSVAASSEAENARLRVSEAYHGQLKLLGDRLDDQWRARLDRLARDARDGDAAAFARVATSGDADAVVFLASDGTAVYPSIASPRDSDGPEPGHAWRRAVALEDAGRCRDAAAEFASIAARETSAAAAARALQAQARCLTRVGDREAVVNLVNGPFVTGRARTGRDRHGRLIAADAHMLAIELMPSSDGRRAAAIQRLTGLLTDYGEPGLPAHQRLFLMRRLRAAVPGVEFPTLPAEALAAEFLSSESGATGRARVEPTSVPEVWKFALGESAVALFRTASISAAAAAALGDPPAAGDVRFVLSPPGAVPGGDAVAASALLPGWQISLRLSAQGAGGAPASRVALYWWTGYLAVALLGVTGFVLWRSFRRQIRLTQLRTDLVAAVSHELKTPLASMRVLVDSLIEDEEHDPERTRRYLKLVATENARLSRLIEHFLTFSRIEGSRHRLVFARTTPGDVVSAAVDALRARHLAAASDLRLEVGPALPALEADADALVTVLLNLLDNAFKYTPRDRRIRLRAYEEQGGLVFEVEDNGIGIHARDQKRIFRRFYQVDRGLSREAGGCGLGLTIVDFIVRAHGGVIGVRSVPGQGSLFRVYLPGRGGAQGAVA